jgi:hypothetical protein
MQCRLKKEKAAKAAYITGSLVSTHTHAITASTRAS